VSRLLGLAKLAACLLMGMTLATAQEIPELVKPDPKNWLTYSGSYDSQRHSPLRQITPSNVHSLAAVFAYHMAGQRNLEVTPVVKDGVMYISQYNRIDAIDARSGNIIWQYQRQPLNDGAQRGTTVYANRIFVTTADRHLLALDRRNGSVLWETAVHDNLQLAGGAPLVAHGKVIVSGNQPNGFIQAYDAESGKYVWEWHPVPHSADEPNARTWAGESWKTGGSPIWLSGSYDPESRLVFYGTGQPNPVWSGATRAGDDLYSDCIVALDVDTGTLKWYFQTTPHDVHDWDSEEMPVLVDAVYQGRPRKLLLQANRNGYYYILDRTNGQFLHGTPFVSQLDWSSGLDANGRPILVPGHDPSVQGTKTCPSTAGATNWPSPTYDPATGYFYVVAQEGCGLNYLESSAPDAETGYLESPREHESWQLYVRALDALTGRKIWDYRQIASHHYGPGLLSTAGGVIFAAEELGQFSALDARTGKPLWHFNTGDMLTAGPISYSVDGRQFVAVASGTNIFAFALPRAPGAGRGR